MFAQEFEKIALVYPGRAHVMRIGGAAAKAAGHVAGILDPGMGSKLKNIGTHEFQRAQRYVAERRAPGVAQNIKNKLEHENFYRKAMGKPEYHVNEEAIKRHATMKAAKQSLGDVGENAKRKSFVERHPKTSLGLGIAGTYLATRPSDNSVSQPMLSR